MTASPRRSVFVACIALALVGLTACANDDGLTVRGSVEVDTGSAMTGFDFPNTVRLDASDVPAAGRISGSCQMRVLDEPADGLRSWGVVVDIHRGGGSEDLGLSSLSISQRSDASPDDAHVSAQLGTTEYASRDGSCSLEVEYAVEGDGLVGLGGDCEIADAEGNTAQMAVQLDLAGCTVLD